MEQKLKGQVEQKQIEEWKKEHPTGIYAIEVGDHVGYFRNPTRRDLNVATSQLDMDNLMDINEVIMKETQLGGSKALIENDELYLGCVEKIRKKLEGKKAKLVNL